MDLRYINNEDSRLLIDTCSMLNPDFEKAVDILKPFLIKSQKQLIIPNSCVNELKKYAAKKDVSISSRAQKVLKFLSGLGEDNLIDIKGGQLDNSHADNVFLTVFTQFRTKYWLYLITEDKKLRKDILKLNESESVKGRKIEIVDIAYIINYQNNREREKGKTDSKQTKKERFSFSSALTTIPDDPITISEVPDEGQDVFTESNGIIKLTEIIKSGGEGKVFKTNARGYVAKVYHKNSLSQHKKHKVEAIIRSGLDIKGVCFPKEALYNGNKEFIGYLMPEADGKSLDASIFKGERGMKRHFPNWKRVELVELAITISDTIRKLHKVGILIGDINGSNILVKSPNEVYFVDTDSYQINEFPCPVGTPEFTPPEIQGKNYRDFLRTVGNENFAIAVLLFRILMLGLNPYAHKDGEGVAKNIQSGDFSFPYRENSNGKAPDGDWKYIWSHLFFPLKGKFYNTFKEGGITYSEDKRPNILSWLNTLKLYKSQLDDGTIGEYDKDSESLIPKSYKKMPNKEYATCIVCGKDHPVEYLTSGICKQCLREDSIYECKRCHGKIAYSNYKKYCLKKTEPVYCKSCQHLIKEEERRRAREERRMEEAARKSNVFKTIICNCCNKGFNLTIGEKEYYDQKGLDLPKRCPDCRKSGRTRSRSENYNSYTSTHRTTTRKDSNSSSSNSGGGLCYLTTVVCEYFGYPDDCYELETLRDFRDNWLAQQPDGPRMVKEYYEIAPSIVECIKKSSKMDVICLHLMNECINPCISLINSHKENECKELYVKMVLELKNKLLN